MTRPRRERCLTSVGRTTLVVSVFSVASVGRVAAHSAPHSAGRQGAALSLFVLGSVTLAGSLYMDRTTDVARTRVDLGVFAGVLALGASIVLFW